MKGLCWVFRKVSKKIRKKKMFMIIVYLGSKVWGGFRGFDMLIMILGCGLIVFLKFVNLG